VILTHPQSRAATQRLWLLRLLAAQPLCPGLPKKRPEAKRQLVQSLLFVAFVCFCAFFNRGFKAPAIAATGFRSGSAAGESVFRQHSRRPWWTRPERAPNALRNSVRSGISVETRPFVIGPESQPGGISRSVWDRQARQNQREHHAEEERLDLVFDHFAHGSSGSSGPTTRAHSHRVNDARFVAEPAPGAECGTMVTFWVRRAGPLTQGKKKDATRRRLHPVVKSRAHELIFPFPYISISFFRRSSFVRMPAGLSLYLPSWLSSISISPLRW